MSTEAVKRYTVEEYLARERASETKSEYYDGEIFAMVGASEAHVLISINLARRLGNALEGRRCRVYNGDMRVKSPGGLYTYPDVSVVCDTPEFEGDQRDTLLNPLVIIEVLSPSTEAYDRGKKFQAYREFPSLQAYVLVAEHRKTIDRFARLDHAKWLLTSVSEGSLQMPELDIELPVDDIYERVEFGRTLV